MCGIAGIVAFGGGPAADEATVGALDRLLAHRGPDGSGSYRSSDGRAVLVHRRLAIIDPHARAAQPMRTADGRWWIAFNGEIYNYRALRSELSARGISLQTESDTEVVLHLIALDGAAALGRLRGMFALGVWDDREGALLVARDRFGMKPLYLTRSGGRVAFASEVSALTRSGLASPEPSPAGLLSFLSWASIPAPLTWARDVEHLEAGTWRRWTRDGSTSCGRFADARAPYGADGPPVSEDELRERCADALVDSVRAHLVADVPVGVFLSGGIDSGALVSTARSVQAGDLHTYTVTVDEQEYSEAPLAREVAARFGTTHHELRVDGDAVAQDLDAMIASFDQPTADAVNSYCVAGAVARTGIKTVLSGVGGDEMFGGYPSFSRIPSAMRVSRAIGPLLQVAGAAPLPLAGWRAAKFRHFAADPALSSAYRATRGFFMPAELESLVGPALRDSPEWDAARAAVADAERAIFEPAGEESVVAAIARMETRGFLASQLLRDVDAVSMAHGLEVRAPFVDHELQSAIWPALGQHPALIPGKRLLRESLRQPLPDAVVSQKKRGFTLPFDAWMRGPLRDVARAGLRALSDADVITRRAADATWTSWETGQAHWSRPWGLAILGRFLQQTR